MDPQNILLHEEPFASQLKEAYTVPLEHDICEALMHIDDYLMLKTNPKGYVWSRKHYEAHNLESARTNLQCVKGALAHINNLSRVLHKIRCNNILTKAHSLAHQSKNTVTTDKYLTSDHIRLAKEQLQVRAPGASVHLHLDSASFTSIKQSLRGLLLHERISHNNSYEAYRGIIKTPGEDFVIHLWVKPNASLQKNTSTTNFMTTYGGLLYDEWNAFDIKKCVEDDYVIHPKIEHRPGFVTPFRESTPAPPFVELYNITICQPNDFAVPWQFAINTVSIDHIFYMTIGDENAIIRLPDSAESPPA